MRASFLVLLCLASLAASQLTPPLDSSCRQNDCIAPETDCVAPENCVPAVGGGAAIAGCGCQCQGCPSCEQGANPKFIKQCSANLVMVLDESGSIDCCTSTVRNAVVSFISSFSSLNNIGGSATLGLIEFASTSTLVNAPGANCVGKMCTLTNTYVSQVTNYVQSNAGGASGYSPGGCTNWAAALSMAATTPWTLDQTGNAIVPDIVLFFTDGDPTVHTGMGTCNTNCNSQRTRIATAPSTFVGQCNGNHVGGACYWSDKLKKAGIKVFLVGIGGITSHIPNTRLVSGPTEWDKQVTTFGSSDYIVDANYAQLGALLNSVAKGLCPCLQDQTPCFDTAVAGQPNCKSQSNFDTRVVITTGPNSATYPSNSVLEAFMYYDFFGQPSRFALEYMQGAALVRTDVINPCNVQRQISCGGLCYSTADLGFVPRFFIAQGDTTPAAAVPGAFVPNAACAAGVSFTKAGQVPNQPTQIATIWMLGGATGSICAARAADGTLYEFFKDSAKTIPGVNLRFPAKPQQLRVTPLAAFNFDQLNTCKSPICNAEVEIVFVIDQILDQSDYFAALSYAKSIALSFDDSNNRIRMGAMFSSAGQTIDWQNQLPIFGNQVLATSKPGVITTNFNQLATAAINYFWPAAPLASDPPRYLVTLVGSVDTQGVWTGAQQTAFDTLRKTRGVEAWATGLALGGVQFGTLISLSDSTTARAPLLAASYNHYVALASAQLLASQAPDQAARMCPRADLCGGTCQGLCLCGVCQCPTCAASPDKCLQSSCVAGTSGCVIVDRRSQPISSGGCLGVPALPCTQYDCDATGACTAPTTPCGATCGCPTVANCFFNDIKQGCGTCHPKPVTCSGDLCGNSCDAATGTCSGQRKICDDGNGCTADNCVIKLVGGVQTAVCQNVDDTAKQCPPSSLCEVTNCTSTGPMSRICSGQNLTSLFDLCGVCNGDFTTCFFAAINPVASGVAGGVVAGIVVGSIVAAALIAFFSRQGYMAYQARSAMAAPSMHNNAAFKDGSNAGYMQM